MLLTLLKVLFGLGIAAGLIFLGLCVVYNYRLKSGYGDDGTKPKKLTVPIVIILVSILLTIVFSAATYVGPKEIGVVENTWSGQLYVLEPGTHIWPFSQRVAPLVTKVYIYSTENRAIEIGSVPAAGGGVSASSSSEGQPVVYFAARGWATINKDTVVELHKKYGADYLDGWVEKLWVSSLKKIQGEHPYDYVANHRQEMETVVEEQLQSQLLGDDGVSNLVIVSQLAIIDFDYDEKVNAYLDSVSQMQFQRQQAEMQIEINKQTQEAEKIAADTTFLVTKRNAEAEAVKRITEAQGAADAVKLAADAEAYRIKAEAEAQSQAIKLIGEKLDPQYIQYLLSLRWNGVNPTVTMGSGTVPVITIPATPQ